MYGLQAINSANGWMITFAGILIVFGGLVILAALIANLERLLNLWDRRAELLSRGRLHDHHEPIPADLVIPEAEPTAADEAVEVITLSADQMEALRYFQWISERLGEPFALPHLLDRAERHGVPRPYSHLAEMIELNLLVEGEGDLQGFYSWRKDVRVVS